MKHLLEGGGIMPPPSLNRVNVGLTLIVEATLIVRLTFTVGVTLMCKVNFANFGSLVPRLPENNRFFDSFACYRNLDAI